MHTSQQKELSKERSVCLAEPSSQNKAVNILCKVSEEEFIKKISSK